MEVKPLFESIIAHGVKRKWIVAAAIYIVGMSVFGPAAEAAFHLDHVNGPPAKGLAVSGMLTAPQEPLGAPLDHFLPKPVFRPRSEPVRLLEPSSGRCGGDLPTCHVMECENHGNLTGKNPSSSASGKWQITDGTWGGYGGYAHAQDAPEDVQDAKARELWAERHGHWAQCL